MKEYWQRTTVCGNDEEMGRIREIVLHRRGEDPMVMAFRRNHALAGCGRIRMETEEVFMMDLAEDRRTAVTIQRDERKEEEWDW